MISDPENTGERGPVIAPDALRPAVGPSALPELSPPPSLREERIVAVMELCTSLDDADLAILAWIASRFPVAALRGRCREITEQGRCAADAKNTFTPTPREHVALASLLGAVRDISVALLGTRSPQ